MNDALIGVLGGMGPLATVDFFAKVVAQAAAGGDALHVPLLIQSDPRIPSRPAAILAGGESPLPALLAGRDRLIAAGAVALAMPCNTAHHWYAELVADCPVPFLSIVDACCDMLPALAPAGAPIGLIATRATLQAQIFDARLRALGYVPVLPDEADLAGSILPAIEQVKAGDPAGAGPALEASVRRLLAAGAQAVVLACTETPLALDAVQSALRARCVDSNAALAHACVAWWKAHGER